MTLPSARAALAIVLTLGAGAAHGEDMAGPSPAKAAARYPQPVRVGRLIGADVLQPTEAQHVLGHVRAFVRAKDGRISMIMTTGGLFGFDTRSVAIPLDAIALLGEYVAILDLTPEQVAALPSGSPADGATPVGPEESIRVALTKPFH